MTPGKIFNIVRYAIHDGQGIRVTVFLRGCPLRCWWCHNPESFAELDSAHPLPTSAAGGFDVRTVTPAEIIAEIEKDQLFFDESGGGATFSGGEPLLQWRFLCEVLTLCRRREIHTAVDTSGYAPREVLAAVAELADLFLFDLKPMDDAVHREFTGVSNRLIHENLTWLALEGKRVIVRLPLVSGITDTERNLAAVTRFLAPLPNLKQIHILPYHRAAARKYARLELPDLLAGLEPPTPERVEAVRAQLSGRGFEVQIGG